MIATSLIVAGQVVLALPKHPKNGIQIHETPNKGRRGQREIVNDCDTCSV
ncbi:MAG: hypothetical protein PWQ51_1813 [Methanolobus sp.]|jgi:muramidase (phage lysozyme)|nr:hypothetical protein [Methanolobus sp.]